MDVHPQAHRGSWKVDERTGKLVKRPAADSYAEKVERERRLLPPPAPHARRVVS